MAKRERRFCGERADQIRVTVIWYTRCCVDYDIRIYLKFKNKFPFKVNIITPF